MKQAREIALKDDVPLACLELVREFPGRRQVWRGEWKGMGVFAKLYLDPRRAVIHCRREKQGLAALQKRDIATATLLYYGETVEGAPILIIREIDNACSLRAALKEGSLAERGATIERMIALVAEHHLKGVCQVDLHSGNFLF